MTLLDVDGIDGYYGESHIIQDVSMTVDEGEITALLGRNGAGKTSTLRCISGATPPEVRDGTIRFDGTDITNQPPEDIAVRGISLVPEERRVFTDLTVAENLHLAETVRNKSNTWNRGLEFKDEGMSTDEIYEFFPRLDERREQKAGTLSGGEQQMLAIARALHQSTDLLMLDEPYEGLAPQIIEAVENAIERISENGTTVLLVEQNAVAAMKIADRCYVLDRGEVVFEGAADELRANDEIRDRYLGV
ncbi:ABC transporter ATP-binding protein [Halomicroarcula sp. F13]|uniref:ABC transporter ATP-binding protein n=1 Tax=Haloarcula rubra TaxID=2487747 RepID=A0AAW4PSG4_9EURY|nr:ABC transporter ATP-binding protein [Halomicroarcula rubra]MBX0324126.1 ABC transporter ATP-binding protein [Halomicroarcula rubra]